MQYGRAFQELYRESNRSVDYRRKIRWNMTLVELDLGWRGDGIVRPMFRDNQLFIIHTHGVWDYNHRPRALPTLRAINRAVAASSELLPDVEFTLTDHDRC